MNDKNIKDITKKSVVKAPHDFTDRLLYRIENEASVTKPVQITVPFIVIGALGFIGVMAWMTTSLPEPSTWGSSFSSQGIKRTFQIVMALFFLLALQWMVRLFKEIKKM